MNHNTNKKDIILEIYNENGLTPRKLKSLINDRSQDSYISSSLLKILIKNNKIELLKIIFDKLKFYDNEFIKWLLFLYKNKTFISTMDLKQEISKDRYKIGINHGREDDLYHKYIYIVENGNKNLIKYLVEYGADINKVVWMNGEIPLFDACKSGNKDLVKYGETPLFGECESENESLVKCYREHETNISEKEGKDEFPLFYTYYNGDRNLMKYFLHLETDISKENKEGETPLLYACY
ncbi:ankyrin repeat-containing domain protein [Neocallimastix lanati (nom. inval.)]|nr:ankyrin repeat-containing domain protein [Neocallimastix sp. JGI-2020a]